MVPQVLCAHLTCVVGKQGGDGNGDVGAGADSNACHHKGAEKQRYHEAANGDAGVNGQHLNEVVDDGAALPWCKQTYVRLMLQVPAHAHVHTCPYAARRASA